jgi:hypothetical protein
VSDDHGRNWGVTPSRTATSEIPDDISQIYSLEMFLYIPLILLSSKVILKVLSTVRSGEPAGTRTQDPRLKRAMLYQLSYRLTLRSVRFYHRRSAPA